MSDGQTEISPEIISEARSLGWAPKEEFRGDVSRWVDADVYVERGHTVMPILRQNNARLMAELQKSNERLAEAVSAIEELKVTSAEITKDRVEAAKREVRAELRKAKEEGNLDREEELQDRLDDLRTAEREAAKPQPKAVATETPAVDPAFTEWQATEGTWFGVDRRKTALAMAVAQDLKLDPVHGRLTGLAFYKKVASEVEATLNPRPGPGEVQSKVEGSRGGAGGGGGGGSPRGKTYADLDADAKAACDSQGKRFIGKPGYKTVEDWRNYYVKMVTAGDE